ncbi:MAG: hypothetical protein U1F76_32235 [Candidatus Competibacteraceae bacterium]
MMRLPFSILALTACFIFTSAQAADKGARHHARGEYDTVTATYVVVEGDDLVAVSERFEIPGGLANIPIRQLSLLGQSDLATRLGLRGHRRGPPWWPGGCDRSGPRAVGQTAGVEADRARGRRALLEWSPARSAVLVWLSVNSDDAT